jgi:hypothetical protein
MMDDTRRDGGPAPAERAEEKPATSYDNAHAAEVLPPAPQAGGEAAPGPLPPAGAAAALTARLCIEYFTDREAKALGLFVYVSTLLLLVATGVLVGLKFLSNERDVLFKNNAWCGSPPMRQPLAVPHLLRRHECTALQQNAPGTCQAQHPGLCLATSLHLCACVSHCWVYCCRYTANMAVAAVSLAGLLGLAAWFAHNLHYTRLERSSWWVGWP